MNRSGGDLTVGPRWGGAALLRAGVLAFAGSIGVTDAHAHHAVQIIAATTAFTVLDEHGARLRGTTVVVATHDRALMDRFGKRVVLLNKGFLIEDGAPVDVLPGAPGQVDAESEHVLIGEEAS